MVLMLKHTKFKKPISEIILYILNRLPIMKFVNNAKSRWPKFTQNFKEPISEIISYFLNRLLIMKYVNNYYNYLTFQTDLTNS